MQQLCPTTKSLTCPPLSIARYSFIQLSQQGSQWRERKFPIFDTEAKGDSNAGSLDCESGILPLSYRAPQSLSAFAGRLSTSLGTSTSMSSGAAQLGSTRMNARYSVSATYISFPRHHGRRSVGDGGGGRVPPLFSLVGTT